MAIKDKILEAIKNSNSTALNLLPTDFTISLPIPLVNTLRNTQLILTSVANSGYNGISTVTYDRRNLNSLAANITLYTQTGFTVSEIITKLNEHTGKQFTVEDFLPFVVPTLTQSNVVRLTITANPDNYFWNGSIVVSLLLGSAGQTTNETVLTAISALDSKFDLFFDNLDVVLSIDGHSGVVTKAMLSIDQLDNTSDLNKPISIATSNALDSKLAKNTAYVTRYNQSNDDLFLGNVVYSVNNNTVNKANASDPLKFSVLGLVSDEIILSQMGSGTIQTTGILTGTVDQWFVATGMVGGLVTGNRYFLDTNSGRITNMVSNTAVAVCPIGKAISQTELSINIETIINL